MKQNKRILLLSLAIISSITLGGCIPQGSSSSSSSSSSFLSNSSSSISSSSSSSSSTSIPLNPEETLHIFSINDTHGAMEDSNLSKLSAFVKGQEQERLLLLSAGDMFQGTAVSNLSNGKAMINMMNAMEFDAMTIGNHEFDWGLDTIAAYWDGDDSNGEANFPLLGANVYDKRTNSRVGFLDDYVIFNRLGIRIAVIGVIGYGLESDIATSMVANYEFKNPVPIVANIASNLRTNQLADVIVVNAHDAAINNYLADLTGSQRVDAVINGHSHGLNKGVISRSPLVGLPFIQAKANAEYLGRISLNYRYETKQVISASTYHIAASSLSTTDAAVDAVQEVEIAAVASIINEEIGISGDTLSYASSAYQWSNDVLLHATGADISFNNAGGIRSGGFPIYNGDHITIGDVYAIMPFDNAIITVTMTGAQITSFLNQYSSILHNDDLFYDSYERKAYLRGIELGSSQTYRVVTIDYLFDNPDYPFLSGTNINRTGELFRDAMIQDIRDSMILKGIWEPLDGSVLTKYLD